MFLVSNVWVTRNMGFPGGSDGKESACNAGDPGSIPEMAAHSSILAWRVPWTEEPGGLQSMGLKESDTTEQLTLWTFSKKHISTSLAINVLS